MVMATCSDKFSNNSLQKYRNEKIKHTFSGIFSSDCRFLAAHFQPLTCQLASIPEKLTPWG